MSAWFFSPCFWDWLGLGLKGWGEGLWPGEGEHGEVFVAWNCGGIGVDGGKKYGYDYDLWIDFSWIGIYMGYLTVQPIANRRRGRSFVMSVYTYTLCSLHLPVRGSGDGVEMVMITYS